LLLPSSLFCSLPLERQLSRGSGHTQLRKEKERSSTETTAFAPNVTECYIQVMLHSFDGILRSGKVSMVFSRYGDLSMLWDQFSHYLVITPSPKGIIESSITCLTKCHSWLTSLTSKILLIIP
jgi:hypothetical protein